MRRYPVVLVEGEIGEIKVASSGHCYLTLRDDQASLHAVVWRSDWRAMHYKPRHGDRVVCRGRLRVYVPRGAYQMQVSLIQPAGEGELARQIEQRKARLAAEGLLDPRRYRELTDVE